MQKKSATIYDIAREAGVSAATVTRVLNGSDKVREVTRVRVQQVIDAYGYVPSEAARGLGSGTTRTLGVILRDIGNPYFSYLFRSADDEARKNGYSLWMCQIPQNRPICQEDVDSMVRRRLDGAFFMGVIDDMKREDVLEMLNRLGRHMPLVAICPPEPGLGCICLYNDLDTGMRQAVRHLHLLGHRRIAMIGGNARIEDCGSRGRAFLDEIDRLGLPRLDAKWRTGGADPESGCREVVRMMTAVPREERPTALIAFNDLVALGAIRQLKQMDLRVPEDMAVIGCDNQFFCPYVDPPLTTIDMQTDEHARSAIRELIHARSNRSDAIMRSTSLIVRESCGVKLGWRDLSGPGR